jgi:cytochrome c-type biogenesis protein CcmH/NrfF
VSPAARRIALLCAATLTLALAPGAWAAAKPRTSLTAVEPDMMCTICHEPLSEAQSLEADQERSYIRSLIAQGLTKAQIERAMVVQYGPGVLARPPAHGVNLTIYILPPAIVVAGLVILAVTLPRWRRRTRAAAEAAENQSRSHPSPALEPAEAQRLEHELSQFRG